MKVGYFLACEEHAPKDLVRQARLAEEAGFEGLWISDHFHPWNAEQGQASFVWAVLGAVAQVTSLPVTTAVTCPIIRMHPVVVAHAAATCSVLLDGRFVLGLGTGEAVNEHVTGAPWPPADIRLDMLEEAISIIRMLHEGGMRRHRGTHFRVDGAQLFTLPERPVPIYVSGLGKRSTRLAARLGDGFVSVFPDPDVVSRFREAGGGDKPVQGGLKVCWAESEEAGVATAHRLWASERLPGNLLRELRSMRDIEQATSLVPAEATREVVPCGPDPERHLRKLRDYAAAGYDEVYVQQIGSEQEAFFSFYAGKVLPRLRAELGA